MPTESVARNAVISGCGRYRYLLSRGWQASTLLPSRLCSMAFIMLNPSTADHKIDDPTIRRCMGFARREGYYGIHVVNLFALRSTNPAAVALSVEPIGPENDRYIEKICLTSDEVVVAWGAQTFARQRAREVANMLSGVSLKCLGTTKDGSPRHPLYVPKNADLIPWRCQ